MRQTSINEIVEKSTADILIYHPYKMNVGSLMLFECKLKNIEQKEDQTFFDFVRVWHKSQATCSWPTKTRVLKKASWWDVRPLLAVWREIVTRRIQSVLPGDEGALIAGMLYGERNLSSNAQDRFRSAGLSHLVAVSGSNITILVNIVFAFLLGIKLGRRQAFWVTGLIIFLFVVFVGFSASVLRAALMGWMILLARHLGRKANVWYLILFVAVGLCLLDPWMLAFDAGFALSFLATLGLVVWTPIISEKIPTAREPANDAKMTDEVACRTTR